MSEQDNSDMIEVVLGLLEQAKQHDASIQKAIEVLEREKIALGAFRSEVTGVAGRVVADEVRNALKTQNNALETHFDRIDSITRQLYHAKRELNWQNALFYFGSFALFMAMVIGFVWWFVPSMDEIRSRTHQLEAINAQIEQSGSLKRLQTSQCDKQLCVKVIESKCNYGKKGDRYCVADLK